jgi:tetratricopeptide (TPR) repeat protein
MPARESPARRDTQSGHAPLQDSPPTAAQSLTRREWLFLAALVLAIFFVYQPAWQGGILWDDDAHLTRPDLRSWQGLYRIWFELDATAQYYPVLHSAFWIEHRMWGDATLGYHLANILFHAVAACLAALILRRLAIPGALLAAAVFALHPVQAESVAWISEQKNTLSAVFYLGAMLVYLRFDQTRKRWLYGCALDLFLLAVLSKTVTATLPGALLVIFWWQRGRLSWRKDVLPLVPFFLLGAGGGLITAWWELKINNCVGPEFQFTLVERLLIAGRAIWFHLGKLCWPATLTFLYPRWQIDSAAWWQYLFPLGVTALLAGCWSIRRRTRAPLAALLFFAGTLFPVLGFFNLYTFRYSLVANHYQYLASLGPFTLAAVGAAWLCAHWRPWPRRVGYAVCLAALAVLAGLTWRQSHMYADSETLYAQTIAENPACWLAHYNLGNALADRGQVDLAIAHYRKALEIKPDYAEAHYNLGNALAGRGQVDLAIAHYRKALEIKPDYAEAHYNLGNALAGRGQVDLAIAHYQKALDVKPDHVKAHNNLAALLAGRGQVDLAVAHYRKALEIKPDYAEAHANLANALLSLGQGEEGLEHLRKVIELSPASAMPRNHLGGALAVQGRFDEALRQFQQAMQIQPDYVDARKNLAWLRATCPQASLRNGAEAIEHARWADHRCGGKRVDVLGTLAAAYAEAGRFSEALTTARKALDLAARQKSQAWTAALRTQIVLYEAGKPYRQTPSPSAPTLSKP